MNRRWMLVCILASSCGRIGFSQLGDGGGLAGDVLLPLDGDAAPLGTFGPASNIAELNLAGVNSEDPSVTDDLREIVFSSTRPTGMGGVDIWASTRASAADTWGAPVLVAGINSTSDDTTPEITGDGLLMVFASNRAGTAGVYDLYEVTRATRGDAWSAPMRIAELASIADEFTGTVTSDRLRMVFSSSRTGGMGGGDLYTSMRGSAGATWGTASNVSINSTDDDSSPWLSADGLTLYFSSTRPGGAGMQDVWISTRIAPSSSWTTPVPVTELNDASYDSDPWLSPDQRIIVYSRLAGSFRNIFTASR